MRFWRSALLAPLLAVGLLRAGPAEPAAPARRTAARFEAQRRMDKTVPIRLDDSVLITSQFSNVEVGTWSQPGIRVAAELTAGADSRACAESCLKTMSVTVLPSGRRVDVRSVADKGSCSATQYQVNLRVTLPQQATLLVTNSYGDVTVLGLEGPVTTSNRFGRTSIDRSARADVTSTFGDVNLGHIGYSALVRNRYGNITAHDLSGLMDIANEGGAIYLTRGTGSGKLLNRLGEITLEGCRGHFTIAGSQAPVIYRMPAGGPDTAIITNRNGTIRLILPPEASAMVNSRAVQGRVECRQAPLAFAADPSGRETTFSYQFGACPAQFGAGSAFFDLTATGAEIVIDTVNR